MGRRERRLSDRTDFRELFDHLDGVVVWTVQEPGEFAYMSAGFEEIWGVGLDDGPVTAEAVLEGVHPEDRSRVVALMERPEEEVAPESIEHRVVQPDGTVRWVETRLVPVRDAEGSISEVIGVTVDITERKRREEELEVLNRVLRHDVRNEMSVAIGWLDTLGEALGEEHQETLERVQTANEHVVELTDIARDYVDVVVGDGDFLLEPVSLPELLEEEIEERRIAYPDATLEVDDPLPDVTVSANDLLTSVFRNLLNNAVQHSDKEDPTVVVSVEAGPETAHIRVADDGPGVPDEQKETIFGKGTTGLDSPGTGMGLFLCRKVVAAYDGRIWVEDNEPEGAVFCVELPRARGDDGGHG